MPKTRTRKKSRSSVEAEDAEPLPPLQTLEPDHNEALSPQRTATTKPPPPPEPQESPVASSGEQRLATEAQASATANEFPSENVGKARDAKRRSAKDASAAKTSSSAKKSPAAKAVATDCEEDIGHTEAELSALSLHHKDGLFYDILDYEQELILHDRTARKIHFPVLQQFWEKYPYRGRRFGRLYARFKMCNILVDACAEPAYAEASLAAWGKREWQECIDDLEQTKAICLRADSRIQMSYHDVEDGEINAERAALVCFNKRFEIVTKACRVNLCIAKIRVDLETQLAAGALGPPAVDPVKVAAVLYVVCDDWIVVPVVRANLTPSRSNLVYCHRNKVKESDSDVVKKHVFNLFQPTGGDPIKDSGDDEQNLPAPQPILKNLEDLKEILSVKPYNLKWWQGRLETLLSEWNEQCFGKNLPSLIVLGYNRPLKPKSKSRMSRQTTPRSRASPARSIELDGLQRGRIALRDDHGEDPLETSRELAEQATGIPRAARSNHGHWTEGNETPTTRRRRSVTNNEENADAEERTSKRPDRSEGRSLYEDKKSKSKLMFDDSTDEEDDQRNDSETELRKKRARLSHVPERRKSSGSGVKKDPDSTYTGPPPDEGIFDTSGNVIHRHQWTEQEMCALVLGLEKFGVGKWVQIKNAYGEILRNRSSVQVKDKYRNMKKNGDLPEEFL